MKRSSGILLPIFSLPSPYGIGCFDSEAYRFVDFLADAGQSYWQILPLGSTSYGDSPYQSYSSFAGNPLYIDLGDLIDRGWLTREECDAADLQGNAHRVDYERQNQKRYSLLRHAFERSGCDDDACFRTFRDETPWLSDFTLFMALKDAHGGTAWYEWEDEYRLRDPEAIHMACQTYRRQMDGYAFLQYLFFCQWKKLRSYANGRGVRIIGDIPIYVAYDSADVWAHPELFRLNEKKEPLAVAGCPPDGFSPDGQLWGNPLYDWDALEQTGYAWWIQRMSHSFDMFDTVRIDHFRGFDEYFSIPYGAKTARGGHWEKGPGMKLFYALEKELGRREVIAEDLGYVTDSVRRLVKDSGFSGMKVLEFGFDGRDTGGAAEHRPHNYSENCVAYTGTHDNQTLSSWFSTVTEAERDEIRGYLCDGFTPKHLLPRSLIALLLRSKAWLCIVPMQDWLGLDDEARINVPSTVGSNWRWRMGAGSASPTLAKEIKYLTQIYGR